MKRLFLYIVLLVAGGQWLGAGAQGVVEGVVTDAKSGAPLEYVNVGVPGNSTGAVTNAKGYYRLELGKGDSVTVRFSFTGYEAEHRRVARRGRTELDVQLKPMATQIQTIEVSDEKNRQSTFTKIETEKLDVAVGPTGGVEAVLKMLPDVQSNNELSSQYSVRGGSFDENLVYINDVEVFRPMLIRSGQQEGMSIINPDMVDYIQFSPGGFDAVYGDKLSSVLDIIYRRRTDSVFSGKVSASLLGASATLQGRAGEKLSYSVGFRRHSNQYLLSSLDTKGSYTTAYTDMQVLLGYKVNEKLDLGVLAVWTNNVYGLVPESQTTAFGSALQPGLEIDIYFDGQEQDRYNTLLGALSADWRPNEDWRVKGHVAVQHINEGERYDIQSQYWLRQISQGASSNDTADFGVGTFLEHARNRLSTDIVTLDLKASRYAQLGSWDMGIKVQMEDISDHLREWKWVDSSGYSLPSVILPLGDSTNMPVSPILQQFVRSNSDMQTWRAAAYLQRELNFHTRRGDDIKVLLGVRGHVYGSHMESNGVRSDVGPEWMVSPRGSVNYKPAVEADLLFRLAAGMYCQSPFYREYRGMDGQLTPNVEPQRSWQVTGTTDWRFRLWDKPCTLTADLYYKHLSNLIPYVVDNLRIRYMPDKTAVGYAAGLSLRLNAELIEGLESWASLSIMKTQEDIEGDGYGWLDRPTDQRVSFKVFLQDNVPDMPWWRMSLNLVFATGTPISSPYGTNGGDQLRLPSYYRVDWGNTVRLSQFEKLKHKPLFRKIEDIQISLEVFNLFNFRNVVSYLWVTDIDNIPRRVPNYLTARQLNLKLTVLF